jgi:hypothetical protein
MIPGSMRRRKACRLSCSALIWAADCEWVVWLILRSAAAATIFAEVIGEFSRGEDIDCSCTRDPHAAESRSFLSAVRYWNVQ